MQSSSSWRHLPLGLEGQVCPLAQHFDHVYAHSVPFTVLKNEFYPVVTDFHRVMHGSKEDQLLPRIMSPNFTCQHFLDIPMLVAIMPRFARVPDTRAFNILGLLGAPR